MNTDMSIMNLVLQASPVVQLVMAILALASVLSWGVIGIKLLQLRRARSSAEAFEHDFWGSSDIW